MDERVTDLEVKVAFQDKLIAELDDVVRALRDELDQLREELEALRASMQPQAQQTIDEEPPHW